MMRFKGVISPLIVISLTVLLIPPMPEEITTEACIESFSEVTGVELIAEPVEVVPEPEFINLGEFRLTAYCSCSRCCSIWSDNRPVDEYGNEIVIGASGKELIAGYSVAVDTSVIPYGTVLVINGQEYEAMDCGGAIKGNRIDIYFNDHESAVQFGVQYADVSIKEEVNNGRDK